MKASERETLTRAEDVDDTLSPALMGKKKKRGERETPVVQSKIIRQTDKIDPLTGTGRSRGYGFLEMKSHKDALKVLRWANNNAEVGQLMWGWWKDEMGDVLERTKKALVEAPTSEPTEEKVGDSLSSKKGVSIGELEERLKRLEARVAEGDERSAGGMRGGKTLIIEFSIENVQASLFFGTKGGLMWFRWEEACRED